MMHVQATGCIRRCYSVLSMASRCTELFAISLEAKPQLTRRQGGDDTFGGFPEHLRALVSHALPKITVRAVTYPKFETRGDLLECVGRFREW